MEHDQEFQALTKRVDSIKIGPQGSAWGEQPRFAAMHLESAAIQARRAGALEKILPGGANYETHHSRDVVREEGYIEHRTCVVGAIFSAVASVDAAVSALFIHANEKNITNSTTIEQNLAAVWGIVRGQPSIQRRADAALHFASVKTTTLASWKDIGHVIQLRNLLTHFTGGMVWTYSDIPDIRPLSEPTELEKILRNKNFDLNPLGVDRIFPITYLSYGCAAWVVNSSRAFTDEFYSQMDKPSPLTDEEDYLKRRGHPSPFSPNLPTAATGQGEGEAQVEEE